MGVRGEMRVLSMLTKAPKYRPGMRVKGRNGGRSV